MRCVPRSGHLKYDSAPSLIDVTVDYVVRLIFTDKRACTANDFITERQTDGRTDGQTGSRNNRRVVVLSGSVCINLHLLINSCKMSV